MDKEKRFKWVHTFEFTKIYNFIAFVKYYV